jgi:hypothetical protein
LLAFWCHREEKGEEKSRKGREQKDEKMRERGREEEKKRLVCTTSSAAKY